MSGGFYDSSYQGLYNESNINATSVNTNDMQVTNLEADYLIVNNSLTCPLIETTNIASQGSTGVNIQGVIFANSGVVTGSTFIGNLQGNADTATTANTSNNLNLNYSNNSVGYLTFSTTPTGTAVPIFTDASSNIICDPATNTIGSGSTNFSGNATTATTATLAQTVNLNNNNNNATEYLLFSGVTGPTGPINTNTSIVVNPSTNSIGNGSTNFLGNATTSTTTTTNVNLSSGSATTNYIPFSTGATGNQQLKTDTGLSYNASTHNLTTTTFTGALSGTATTASNITTANNAGSTGYICFSTTATGTTEPIYTNTSLIVNPSSNSIGNGSTTFSGNATTATTATNANNVYINYSTSASTFYPTFTNNSSGDYALYQNNNLGFVPSTGALYATSFNGALVGNASTATTATNANNVNLSNNTSNATEYLCFSATATGNQPINTNTSIVVNPSTNTIGNASTTFSGNATTATTATNVTTANVTANSTYWMLFTNSGSGGNNPCKTNSTFTFNPSTSTLTATNFAGNATTSTNSTNVNLTNSTTNAVQYIPFSATATGNQPLNTNTALSYNPSTNILSNNSVNVDSPIGSLIMYIATTAPNTNWHVCDGSAISRTTYATLYGLIGTAYGSGDGSTTFNIPDMRQKMPYGYQVTTNALGVTGGSSTSSLITANLPSHNHTVGGVSVNTPSNTVYSGPTTAYLQGSSSSHAVGIGAQGCSVSGNTDNTGSGSSFNTISPFISVNFLLKIL